MAPSLGLGCWRLKTASCWRRARFSSIRLRRVRNPRSTAPSQSRNRSNMATKLSQTDSAGCPAKLLISQPDRIVTRDNISVGLLGVKMEIPVKELLQSSLHE